MVAKSIAKNVLFIQNPTDYTLLSGHFFLSSQSPTIGD